MTYFKISEYKLRGFRKSNTKHKKYDAIIENKKTKKINNVPFGDSRHKMYQDKTGLNLYPHLIHSDKKRRDSYRSRHKHFLREGFFSPGYFAYYYLW